MQKKFGPKPTRSFTAKQYAKIAHHHLNKAGKALGKLESPVSETIKGTKSKAKKNELDNYSYNPFR